MNDEAEFGVNDISEEKYNQLKKEVIMAKKKKARTHWVIICKNKDHYNQLKKEVTMAKKKAKKKKAKKKTKKRKAKK